VASNNSLVLIPTIPQNQTFQIVLNAITYNFAITWNDIAQAWILDIYDIDNDPIITGIAITTSLNLLDQYDYLELGFELYVGSTVGPITTMPTFTDLGVTVQLYANLVQTPGPTEIVPQV
jgi:hypothetical protein